MSSFRHGAIAAVSVLALAGMAGCSHSAHVVPDQLPATVLYPLLISEQKLADQIPQPFDSFDGFLLEDTRELGKSAIGQFFLATGFEEEVCFVSIINPKVDEFDSQSAAATCPTGLEVQDKGISLSVDTGTSQTTAFLLPPDIDSQTVKTAMANAADALKVKVEVDGEEQQPAVLETLSKGEATVVVANSEAMNQLQEIRLPREAKADLVLRVS